MKYIIKQITIKNMKLQALILSLSGISTFTFLIYAFNFVSDGFYYKWQFTEISSHDIRLYAIFILWGMFMWWGTSKLKGKIKSWRH